jgi:soluble lytic murein transglycosylase
VKFIAFILGALLVLAVPASAANLSPEQLAAYRAALTAADKGDWSAARARAAQSRHPIADKFVRWLEYRTSGSGALFDEIVGFMQANPDWPGQRSLRTRAEETMGPTVPDETVLAWFAESPPRTAEGASRYAEALFRKGDEASATAVVRMAWAQLSLPSKQEKDFLAAFGAWLRPEDYSRRLDRLIWDGQEAAARAFLPLTTPGDRAVAEARLRLRRQEPGVERWLDAVPASLRSHPGLIYERARWHRLRGQDAAARAVLLEAPTIADRPDLWWQERSLQARRALAEGFVTEAYQIASAHGFLEGAAYAEAEWLSGWIALRYLNDPATAQRHFAAMAGKVVTRVSRSRANYWLGRAHEVGGQQTEARVAYAEAARHPMLFYGQLALQRLGHASAGLNEARPEDADRAAFEKREIVRLVRILDELGRRDLVDMFLERLDETATMPSEAALVLSLAHEIGRPDAAVRLARRNKRDDVTFLSLGYPVVTVPAGAAEEPLILAMIRQESAFNPNAVSHAGARGLLQLMPATAKRVAEQMKMRFTPQKLTGDPAYNLLLGRTYMDQQLADFSGSYVLAAAAYNAGPHRVRQWLRSNGDPRLSEVDAVDWIESIPFSETRDYVQRVIEGLQAYRWRLGDAQRLARVEQDLRRGGMQAASSP